MRVGEPDGCRAGAAPSLLQGRVYWTNDDRQAQNEAVQSEAMQDGAFADGALVVGAVGRHGSPASSVTATDVFVFGYCCCNDDPPRLEMMSHLTPA
jgi:hypothetical protein